MFLLEDANIQSLQKSKAARVLTKDICKKIERIFDDGKIVSLSPRAFLSLNFFSLLFTIFRIAFVYARKNLVKPSNMRIK